MFRLVRFIAEINAAVSSSKPLARAHELLQKLADRFDNNSIIWDAGIEQDLRAVGDDLDTVVKPIHDLEAFVMASCVLLTLNVLLRYDDHWGALFKKAGSGQGELITKIQLWMYRVLKGIPEQSPTWEVAELREGTKGFKAGHLLWCHRRSQKGLKEKERDSFLPDHASASTGGSETSAETCSVTDRTGRDTPSNAGLSAASDNTASQRSSP
jgi:hypothetical protein